MEFEKQKDLSYEIYDLVDDLDGENKVIKTTEKEYIGFIEKINGEWNFASENSKKEDYFNNIQELKEILKFMEGLK